MPRPGRNVDVSLLQTGLELEVDVELDLPQMLANAAFVQECSQPLRLLGREDDRR